MAEVAARPASQCHIRSIDRIKGSDKCWCDAGDPEVEIHEVKSYPVNKVAPQALMRLAIHDTTHEGVCHSLIIFGGSHSKLGAMLSKMDIPFIGCGEWHTSSPYENLPAPRILLLLCYKKWVPQQGQPLSRRSRTCAIVIRKVAIDHGLCLALRTGSTAGPEMRRDLRQG